MTEALFLEAAIHEEQLLEQGERRLNVSAIGLPKVDNSLFPMPIYINRRSKFDRR